VLPALPFLVRGGYASAKGTLVGGLDPWPSDTLPADSCKAPTIAIDPTLSATAGDMLSAAHLMHVTALPREPVVVAQCCRWRLRCALCGFSPLLCNTPDTSAVHRGCY
jgi:hypothetical protein